MNPARLRSPLLRQSSANMKARNWWLDDSSSEEDSSCSGSDAACHPVISHELIHAEPSKIDCEDSSLESDSERKQQLSRASNFRQAWFTQGDSTATACPEDTDGTIQEEAIQSVLGTNNDKADESSEDDDVLPTTGLATRFRQAWCTDDDDTTTYHDDDAPATTDEPCTHRKQPQMILLGAGNAEDSSEDEWNTPGVVRNTLAKAPPTETAASDQDLEASRVICDKRQSAVLVSEEMDATVTSKTAMSAKEVQSKENSQGHATNNQSLEKKHKSRTSRKAHHRKKKKHRGKEVVTKEEQESILTTLRQSFSMKDKIVWPTQETLCSTDDDMDDIGIVDLCKKSANSKKTKTKDEAKSKKERHKLKHDTQKNELVSTANPFAAIPDRGMRNSMACKQTPVQLIGLLDDGDTECNDSDLLGEDGDCEILIPLTSVAVGRGMAVDPFAALPDRGMRNSMICKSSAPPGGLLSVQYSDEEDENLLSKSSKKKKKHSEKDKKKNSPKRKDTTAQAMDPFAAIPDTSMSAARKNEKCSRPFKNGKQVKFASTEKEQNGIVIHNVKCLKEFDLWYKRCDLKRIHDEAEEMGKLFTQTRKEYGMALCALYDSFQKTLSCSDKAMLLKFLGRNSRARGLEDCIIDNGRALRRRHRTLILACPRETISQVSMDASKACIYMAYQMAEFDAAEAKKASVPSRDECAQDRVVRIHNELL